MKEYQMTSEIGFKFLGKMVGLCLGSKQMQDPECSLKYDHVSPEKAEHEAMDTDIWECE